MGNSNSKVKSNDLYEPPKVDFSGIDSISPAEVMLAKVKKENKIADTKEKIKPKSSATKSKNAIAKCPLKDKTPKVEPKSKKDPSKAASPDKCNLSTLSVNKEGRQFILNINAVKNANNIGYLEIVSGYNKRRKLVICVPKGLSVCKTIHLKKVIDFNDAYESKNDSELKFKAFCATSFYFFPWKPATTKYTVNANTCNAIIGAEIIVYPDTYWKLTVITELKENKIDNIIVTGLFKEDDNNLNFTVSTKKASVDFSYSNDNISVGGGISNSKDKKGGYYNYKDENMEQSASAYNDQVTATYKDQNLQYDTKLSNDESKLYYKDSEKLIDASSKEGEAKIGYKDKDQTYISYANQTDVGTHYKSNTVQYDNHYSGQKLVKDVAGNKLSLSPTDNDRQLKGQIQTKLFGYIETLQKTIAIIQFVEKIISTLTETLESPITFDINWPKIGLTGEWYWKEIPGSPKCGFEVIVNGNFSPLIGCHCNIDIVGAALTAIPYVGKIITRLVNLYKDLTHNDFKINLSISNDLNFSFDITKKATSETFEFTAPPALNKFALKLTAEVKSQKGNLIMAIAGAKHGGGMEGTASINIYLSKPINTLDGFEIPCDFEFTGISIVTYKLVKATSEFSVVHPDDENFEFDRAYEKSEPQNWLSIEKQPFSIPIIAF